MKTTALITGASSGIGYELSKLFAQNGHDLVLVARNQAKLNQLAVLLIEQYGIQVKVIAVDLSTPSAPDEIFSELERDSIRVDILVNNAGTQVYGLFAKNDLTKELQMIQINLTTLTQLTKLFLPGMIERQNGKILNIGSTGSFAPGVYNAVYCATKAYVLSFSEAIAEEIEGTGVTVTCLCPGATQTDFISKAGMDNVNLFQSQVMDAATVAKIGYEGLMKEKRVVVAGLANKLTVFSIRFAPRWFVTKSSKRMMAQR